MEKRITVEVNGLVTGYRTRKGEVRISDPIDAGLLSGEVTCLLGPNGAGKSTLLRTLSALQPPLSGQIMVEGRTLDSYRHGRLARVIGVVLTERLTLENMTVEELVGMGRSPYTGFWGTLSEHDREIVAEAIALVGIEELRTRNVYTLSDGERQKVMIAKALAQETPVIFLDEPTAFLDYPSKVEIMQLLHRLSRLRHATIFLSTHDLDLALQLADKLWLMDKRLGVVTGTPEDLSLNGDMSRFFEREGVKFDRSTGMFGISTPVRSQILLSGEGPVCNMIRKALRRNSIEAVASSDSQLRSIKVEAGVITLDGVRMADIEALLSALVTD